VNHLKHRQEQPRNHFHPLEMLIIIKPMGLIHQVNFKLSFSN